jgi:predicted kinase
MIDMATMAIMIGIQASGKSSFCKANLQEYTRINLDELNTRNKERIAIMAAIQSGENLVIDNTNPTVADREKYISIAKKHDYGIVGYFMQSKLQDCIGRNEQREGKACIPKKAIAFTSNKLEIPDYSEGFDKLYFVSICDNGYKIDEWRSE